MKRRYFGRKGPQIQRPGEPVQKARGSKAKTRAVLSAVYRDIAAYKPGGADD